MGHGRLRWCRILFDMAFDSGGDTATSLGAVHAGANVAAADIQTKRVANVVWYHMYRMIPEYEWPDLSGLSVDVS